VVVQVDSALLRSYLGPASGLCVSVVPQNRNVMAGAAGDDISLLIDNSDIKSMRSSINVSERDDTASVEIADFSAVHQKFGAVR